MKKLIPLVLVLLLAGCTAFSDKISPAQQAGAVCRSYSLVLESLIPLKPKMTLRQVDIVNGTSDVIVPWCKAVAGGESVTDSLIDVAQSRLNELVQLAFDLKGAT